MKYTFSDINAKIADNENKLRDLKTAFLEGVTLQTGVTVARTEITVVRMMNVVEYFGGPSFLRPSPDVTEEAIHLIDTPLARGIRQICFPRTREALLQEICDILNNPANDAPQACFLTGVAGSGNSTIAHTIAQLCDGQRRVGLSYCFASGDVARRNLRNLFGTIA